MIFILSAHADSRIGIIKSPLIILFIRGDCPQDISPLKPEWKTIYLFIYFFGSI